MMDTAAAEAVRVELGLDQPMLIQLGGWLLSLVQFDLGGSLVSGTPVSDVTCH